MAKSTGQVTKWVGLAAGIWVQGLAGNGYVFPHFAPALKQELFLNQVQLNNLGVAKDFGENFGLLVGMLTNLLPPWTILLIGALEGFFAYGTLWLVMSGHITPLPYWQMCIILMIGANSTTCFNTAVLVTTIRNFRESRGMVVGVVKGFLGLSSAIFTQIFVALLNNNAANFVLLLAVGPSAVCVLVMYFIQPVNSNSSNRSSSTRSDSSPNNSADQKEEKCTDSKEQMGFTFIHIVCIGLAAYLLFVSVFETIVPEIPPIIYFFIVAVMFFFLLSPLLVPAKFARAEYLANRKSLINQQQTSNSTSNLQKVPNIIIDGGDLREPLLMASEDRQSDDLSSNSSSNSSANSSPHAVLDPPVVRDEEEQQGGESDQQQAANVSCEDQTSSFDPMAFTVYDKSKLSSFGSGGSEPSYRNNSGLSISRSESGESDPGTLLAVAEGAVKRPRKGPRRGEDFTLTQALVKADFWLLFCTYFCGMGTGITVVNNLGQMGQAQGYTEVTIFVSIVGIMNFLGRLGGGALSEYFVRSRALPRTVWLLAAQLLMSVGHLLFATALPGSLYVGSIILGLCYGMHVVIMVPTASELFGLRDFGMIYNFMAMGNPIGSLLFSGVIAGHLYDRESDATSSLTKRTIFSIREHILARYVRNSVTLHSEGATCLGAHCFELTFIIMALVCLVGALLTFVLTMRIRRVYRSLYGPGSASYRNLASATAADGSNNDKAIVRSPPPPQRLQ